MSETPNIARTNVGKVPEATISPVNKRQAENKNPPYFSDKRKMQTTLFSEAGEGLELAYRLHYSRTSDSSAPTSSAPGAADDARPVFVLIHGIGMSHRYFARLQAKLLIHGDVFLLDLPGFGGTLRPARQLTVAEYASVIANALDAAGLTSCVVAGHSMGAQFVTELALQRPDLVSAVVLIGPVTDTAHPSAARNALTLTLDTLLERPVTNLQVAAAYLQCGLRWYRTELPVMLRYRLDHRLAGVTQPVLVLRGSLDPIAGRRWCQRLAAVARDGRVVEVPGQPHAAHRGGAMIVADAILDLITNLPAAPSGVRSGQKSGDSNLVPLHPAPGDSSPTSSSWTGGSSGTTEVSRSGTQAQWQGIMLTDMPRKGTPMEAPRRFDKITIIFNPNSTGDAPRLAEELAGELAPALPDTVVTLQPTEHAGHAIDLAREAASAGNALIVSVSGDGGYNEVVNGVMASGRDDAVCSVLAAGNANDHSRVTGRKPLAEAIIEGQVRRIDVLRISISQTGADPVYAHSYIGFGLTPIMAIDLEKGSKGAIKEMFSVVRTFSKFKPFEIRQSDGKRRTFDSLVFANISQMAKYATLSEAGDQPTDGKFEVIIFPHMAKWRILLTALRATTKGLGDQPSYAQYRFSALKPMPYQIDGEVKSVDTDTDITIDSIPRALAILG
ncbi:pimeloyl-ACP methyl ester carboxylesterase/diacylglycerol kinase family enzyme [Arthrobacter sp. CAN_A212]|uniref:alpha/beta fold hydrolase n=1 Tax=Arthrobacter sp. CAN_A212 TaxID=2787719 RepID=UPI0018CA5CBA